jgi:hypothetical protein
MRQGALFDTRQETRPLRSVVDRAQANETQWRVLLECGHSIERVSHTRSEAKKMRCTACGKFGNDENGLKYKVDNGSP